MEIQKKFVLEILKLACSKQINYSIVLLFTDRQT